MNLLSQKDIHVQNMYSRILDTLESRRDRHQRHANSQTHTHTHTHTHTDTHTHIYIRISYSAVAISDQHTANKQANNINGAAFFPNDHNLAEDRDIEDGIDEVYGKEGLILITMNRTRYNYSGLIVNVIYEIVRHILFYYGKRIAVVAPQSTDRDRQFDIRRFTSNALICMYLYSPANCVKDYIGCASTDASDNLWIKYPHSFRS